MARIPPEAHAAPFYVVTYDNRGSNVFRRSTGIYELDMDRMTRAGLVADVQAWQFDNIARIYECHPGESCTDITADIASEVMLAELGDNGFLPDYMIDWLEDVLGCRAVADARREYAA